jgi:hypothetical protein
VAPSLAEVWSKANHAHPIDTGDVMCTIASPSNFLWAYLELEAALRQVPPMMNYLVLQIND